MSPNAEKTLYHLFAVLLALGGYFISPHPALANEQVISSVIELSVVLTGIFTGVLGVLIFTSETDEIRKGRRIRSSRALLVLIFLGFAAFATATVSHVCPPLAKWSIVFASSLLVATLFTLVAIVRNSAT